MKSIDYLYSYRTYAGCLEGIPPLESVYDSIKGTVKKLWGTRVIHIVEPKIKVMPKSSHFEEKQLLPRWTHIAWVHGPEKDPENHGSELIVVWFTDEPLQPVVLDDIISQEVWEAHAEDFQY